MIALIFNNITKHRKYPTNKKFTNSIRKMFIKNKSDDMESVA